MALLAPNTDYTALDKTALDARLAQLVQSAWPTWTDQQRANFGNVLDELFTFVGDVTNYLQGRHFREAFFAWLVQRRNAVALAKQYGYTPWGSVATSFGEVFTIPSVRAYDVPIPVGSTVRTGDQNAPTVFQVLEAFVIPAGSTSAIGTVENSSPASDALTSDGSPGQTFTLTATPYLDGSLTPTTAEPLLGLRWGADLWRQVPSLLPYGPGDRVFVVVVDENDRAMIRVGDGVTGAVPPVNVTGQAVYKTGGGTGGNVNVGSINRADGTFFDTNGTQVVVTVNNPDLPITLGQDRESVPSICANAPASVTTPINTISRPDYETNAKAVAGVARALATGNAEDPGVPLGQEYLYIVPDGGGVPTDVLLGQVTTRVTVTKPCPTAMIVAVLAAPYLVVNVFARFWAKAGTLPVAAAANIRAALAARFALYQADGVTHNPLVDWGYNIKGSDGLPLGLLALSDPFTVVDTAPGVLRLGSAAADFTLNGVHADLAQARNQFQKLGTVTLVNGATGLPV